MAATPDGARVVCNANNTPFECLRWSTEAGYETLAYPDPAQEPFVFAVDALGVVVAGLDFGSSPLVAFRASPSGTLHLLFPQHGDAGAIGMSRDGSIVIGYSTSDVSTGARRAFLWSAATGLVDLNEYIPTLGLDLTGWTLENARSISADKRRITGTGTFNGVRQSWLLTLPEPCAGDANGDYAVSFPDLNRVLSNFGVTGEPGTIPGDLNLDGAVNFVDLNEVLSFFGVAC